LFLELKFKPRPIVNLRRNPGVQPLLARDLPTSDAAVMVYQME
jgi:hypothetical protein